MYHTKAPLAITMCCATGVRLHNAQFAHGPRLSNTPPPSLRVRNMLLNMYYTVAGVGDVEQKMLLNNRAVLIDMGLTERGP